MTLDRIKDAIRTLRVNARLPGMEQVAGGWSTDGGPTSIGEALRRVEIVLLAFPKMLSALESIKAPSDETLDAVDDGRRSGTRMLPTSISLGDLKRINAALRAAREAVKP